MSDADELSFDTTAGAVSQSCTDCGNALTQRYWEWQGKAVCADCHDSLSQRLAADRNSASFPRALLLGGGTAIGCGIAYAVFVAVTDFQLALITIGIAYLVGRVVRNASRGFGGLRYQLLAVVLTYVASTMGYAPALWSALSATPQSAEPDDSDLDSRVDARLDATSSDGVAVTPNGDRRALDPSVTQEDGVSVEASTAPAATEPPSLLGFLLALVIFAGLMLASPFLLITDAPIGFLIVCFGLWEAWKQARSVDVAIAGPFVLAAVPPIDASTSDGDFSASPAPAEVENDVSPPTST